MTARLLSLVAVLALLLGARVCLAGAGTAPAGQPALAEIADIAGFKAEFNRGVDRLRAIVLVSPSCPYCLKGASSIQRLLDANTNRLLSVFVVWQPIQPTDWGRPRSGPLHRINDTRARQYWDAGHLVAAALQASFGDRDEQPDCCDYRGIWWDMIAVFPAGTSWADTLPEPLLLAGTVEDGAPAFQAILEKLPSPLLVPPSGTVSR